MNVSQTKTPEEIQEILKKHKMWLDGEEGGERANLRYASLRGANLRGANLRGAYLRYANLRYADLRNADLRGANLQDANLQGANLRYANLQDANLQGANLRDADLRGADLQGADLQGADLRYADLRNADLRYANLQDANLQDAKFSDYVPHVPRLDSKILSTIDTGGSLDMSSWHACETTHCRAGWAVVLAGDEGKALENRYGTATAGALIYAKSTGRVPDFYTSDDEALEDIRQCAAKETK